MTNGSHKVISESYTALLCMRLASNKDTLAIREKLLRALKVLNRQEAVDDWPDYVNPYLDALYAALRLDGFTRDEASEYIAVTKRF